MQKKMQGIIIGVGMLLAGSEFASAGSLGLVQRPPDIASGFIDVSYNASTKAFHAAGDPVSYDLDGIAPADYFIFGGSFDLTATISNSGVLAPGGKLVITGDVYHNPDFAFLTGGTLLTGDLTRMGAPAAGGKVFEFKFNVTGGAFASDYGPLGGIILHLDTPFAGTFETNYVARTANATADTFAVPLPAAFPAGLGLLAALGIARWRKH